MMALHRLADFCVVSSLHDGMNLVAKEFVTSRTDGDGVLLLSQFAGSVLELSDAVLFNPFAVNELSEAIHQALMMKPAERKRRMQRMRTAVNENNVYRWAGKILSALLKVNTAEPADSKLPSSPDLLRYTDEPSKHHSPELRSNIAGRAKRASAR